MRAKRFEQRAVGFLRHTDEQWSYACEDDGWEGDGRFFAREHLVKKHHLVEHLAERELTTARERALGRVTPMLYIPRRLDGLTARLAA